ncbi:MAG: hypothetical protein WC650_01000 [Candidatus Doudnabacteria bacterium]
MSSFEEVKQNVLEQINHLVSVSCDNQIKICSLRQLNTNARFRGGSCPGAKSVCDDVEGTSSIQGLKDSLGSLMCVQTMFGHILKEGE